LPPPPELSLGLGEKMKKKGKRGSRKGERREGRGNGREKGHEGMEKGKGKNHTKKGGPLKLNFLGHQNAPLYYKNTRVI